jgi:hypothetical protein
MFAEAHCSAFVFPLITKALVLFLQPTNDGVTEVVS